MPDSMRSIEVTSRSGRVTIHAGDVAEPTIIKGSGTIDDHGVVRAPGQSSIEIGCPTGTDVVVGAASGSVRCTGRLGRVAITTTSGAIEIEDAASIDVRTKSSSVTIGRCRDTCAVVTKSGRVRIDDAAAVTATTTSGRIDVGAASDVEIRSAAGTVHVRASGEGRILVQTVSGSVEISVPPAADPVINLTSRSGSIATDRPASDQAGTGVGALDVETVSGKITVRHT
ncbi:MAG TPA: DUF4097 family beta strand repeat-containing protein [Ilumatobacteraceae bacterium]